ncbi:MAG: hypothetical protein IIA90_09025, partial [Chloroflexi bacterium]|nr:hypothetical protein [Chloroflexota bacterium]
MSDEKKKSQATIMTELAIESGAVLFHTPEFKEYAALQVDGHVETMALKGQAVRRWLASLYRQATGGAVPGSQPIQDALTALQGRAVHEGDEEDVHIRIAGHEGAIYIDLGDRDWRVVKISTEGWEVLDVAPVYFRRTREMLPLPEPESGSIDALRPLLNTSSDTDFRLLMTTLATGFFPDGPFVVLVVTGEQGSAKSFLTRLMRDLIDPSAAPLRTLPRNTRDLMISATNAWTLNFDNVSYIPAWMSDALCGLSTGTGFATRELYTDSEEMIFAAARPIILNGISSFVTRGDLADRALTITLPQVPEGERRPDDVINDEFARARPYIFGGVLDLVVEALRHERTVQIAHYPRMAIFARRGYAMASLLGWTGDDFLIAYRDRMRDAGGDVLDSSLIAGLLIALTREKGPWEGTATELMSEMNSRASNTMRESKLWPRAANALSNEVKRLAPTLRATERIEATTGKTGGRRWIAIRQVGENIVQTAPPSRPESFRVRNGGDSRDDGETVKDDPPATQMPGFIPERDDWTVGDVTLPN